MVYVPRWWDKGTVIIWYLNLIIVGLDSTEVTTDLN